MFKIKTYNKISEAGLHLLDKTKYELTDDINEADAVLLRSQSLHDIEIPKNVKVIARCGAGVNNIPVSDMAEAGVVVFNTPGANAVAVKELVIMSLFLTQRDIIGGMNWVESLDKTVEVSKLVEKEKKKFAGFEVNGKTLGVIGLGEIGSLVANTATNLGLNVIGYDPYIKIHKAIKLSTQIKFTSDLDYLLENSDIITLHLPFMDSTKGFINEEKIAKMKDNVSIINFARNQLVDNEALIAAIDSSKVKKYVTDFPSADLINNPNIINIPHLGASTKESEDNCAIMAVNQTVDFLENGTIKNSVNYPQSSLPSTNDLTRVGILHKNIPSMIGKVTTLFGEYNINIANMVNQSRNDYSYMLIDVDNEISQELADKAVEIEGIIKVNLH